MTESAEKNKNGGDRDERAVAAWINIPKRMVQFKLALDEEYLEGMEKLMVKEISRPALRQRKERISKSRFALIEMKGVLRLQ